MTEDTVQQQTAAAVVNRTGKAGMPRRAFLARAGGSAWAAGTCGAVASLRAASRAEQADPSPDRTEDPPGGREVRLERLRPREIEKAMQACPVLYQPLGTVEWHGLHNIVGLDAVKAHHLCIHAARRGGGVVAPAVFGGVGGLDQPHTFVMEPENDVHSTLVRDWVGKLGREAVRQGFRAVIILTGHYGAAQQIVIRDVAVRLTRSLGVPVLGTPEYFLALDAGYWGDHAAWGETSLMLHLDPESVDLSRLGQPPHKGVGGRDPREATRADGERLAETIIVRLARLASQMPRWDASTRQRFVEAEAALVNRQLELAVSEKAVWAGWRNIGKGAFSDYGRLLAEQKFEEIIELTRQL
jgi:creatinine amidohydrolase